MFVHPPRGGRGGGAASLNAADTAPGVARARASNSSKNAAPCASVGYLVRLSAAVSVMTRSASKPSGTLTTFHRLRSNSAEPPSSASVSATCMVTSANRTRGLAPGDDVPVERSPCRPPARKTEIAGHRPIATPVITTSRAATTNTRTSIDASAMPEMLPAPSRRTSAGARMPQGARHRRPSATSSRLSASARRASRSLPAPTAARTANSRWRSATRASMRFATFTHAISRKMATAPRSSQADSRCVADPAVAQRLHVSRRHAWTAARTSASPATGAPASVPRALVSRPA